MPTSPYPDTLAGFAEAIRREFCVRSAIAPALFAAAVSIHRDLEYDAGNDPRAPIHDALNWRLTRFGNQARTSFCGALLLQESGDCWQAKLNRPLIDKRKSGRRTDGSERIEIRKYESPAGDGSKPYLPPIPASIRDRIGQRYGVKVPHEGSFWEWLAEHPEIPILVTEGGKKGMALLSRGYAAIALVGVHGGYRAKDRLGVPQPPVLIPELQPFASGGRQIVLAFDRDEKLKTRKTVAKALGRFGALLETATGETVRVASWHPRQGKGADDVIVQSGGQVLDDAIARARSLEEWHLLNLLDWRLTTPADLHLTTPDLSQLQIESLPERGLVGLVSAKGTGKTKSMQAWVRDTESVLLPTHRIALGRNLCHRLGVDYIGDLDKVQGRFIRDGGYALRVGFCVDSLLAIDPEQFRGCDLVIDEAVQVLRHLLTSSTCNKDGKRPVLLARLRLLVQCARRVFLADADLSDEVLTYFQALRGDGGKPFLLRNDYQPDGFSVQMHVAPDPSPAIAQLLSDIAAGQKVFVAVDSKRGSKALDRLVRQIERVGRRVLLINSETSSGDFEREFVQAPDRHLDQFDVAIATPSLATGVSIESQWFDKVYGLFWGVSSTDADIAQALGRVRAAVPRVVWCAQRGRNFSSVSRSTSPKELRETLKDRTSTTVALIRAGLREDAELAAATYDWGHDPLLQLWSCFEAERNRSMTNLRAALAARLRWEGNAVEFVETETCAPVKEQLSAAKKEIRGLEAAAIAGARTLSSTEVEVLSSKEDATPEERLALKKHYLAEFYAVEPEQVTPALAEADRDGQWRTELLALEALIYPHAIAGRDARSLERQVQWESGLCPWDLSHHRLRRELRTHLGLPELLDPTREWSRAELADIGAKARQAKPAVKRALNFTVSDRLSDTQIAHQLLSQLGLRTTFRWCRNYPGHEGEKIRVFRLHPETWTAATDVLRRREAQRQAMSAGSPPNSQALTAGGDPGKITLAEAIRQGRVQLEQAIAAGAPVVLAVARQWSEELRELVLEGVIRHCPELTDQLAEVCPEVFAIEAVPKPK